MTTFPVKRTLVYIAKCVAVRSAGLPDRPFTELS